VSVSRAKGTDPRWAHQHLPLADRLWLHSTPAAGGCIEYTGYVDRETGYGQIGHNGRLKGVHRVSWELVNGPVPTGLLVRHDCDNKPCINPEHLRVGTHADNRADAVQRGRIAQGFRLPHTRLSDTDVQSLRADHAQGLTYRELAAKYSITAIYAGQLVRRIYRKSA
jgi:hypothetical protein